MKGTGMSEQLLQPPITFKGSLVSPTPLDPLKELGALTRTGRSHPKPLTGLGASSGWGGPNLHTEGREGPGAGAGQDEGAQ